MKINFTLFIDKYKNDKNSLGKNLIINKKDIKSHYSGWLNQDLQPSIEKNYNKIVFGFCNSILVLENGDIISNSYKNKGVVYSYTDVLKFDIKRKGFVSKGEILDNNKKIVGTCFGNSISVGISLFDEFIKFLKENPPKEKVVTKTKPTTKNKEVTEKKKIEVKKKTKIEVKKKKEEEIKLIEKSIKNISELENSLSKTSHTVNINLNKIENLTQDVKNIIGDINKNKKSSKLCVVLSKLPNQCCGSVILYNHLNLNKNSFNEIKFNNIVRFVSHIEKLESNYRNLYLESCNKYGKYPEDKCHQNLFQTLKILKEFYRYSSIIMLEFNRDLVLFNQVYNELEDQGLFLSKIQKDKILTLKSIDKGISDMENSLITQFSSLIEETRSQNIKLDLINNNLEYIDGSLSMIDSSLYLINNSLDDIYFNLPN